MKKLLLAVFIMLIGVVGLYAQGTPLLVRGYAFWEDGTTPHSEANFGFTMTNSFSTPHEYNAPDVDYSLNEEVIYEPETGLFEIQLAYLMVHPMLGVDFQFYGDGGEGVPILNFHLDTPDPLAGTIVLSEPLAYGGSSGPNLPSWATLTAPADGATGILPYNVYLNWDYEGEAVTGYELTLNGESMGDVTVSTGYYCNVLEYGTPYTWSVKPYIETFPEPTVRSERYKNTSARVTERLYPEGEMPEWTFTTMDAPVPPAVTTPGPMDGATGVGIDELTLSWVLPEFAYANDVVYNVYLGTTEILGSEDLLAEGITATSYALEGDLDYATTYYWKVEAIFDDNHLIPELRVRSNKTKVHAQVSARTEYSSESETWDFGTEDMPEPTQPTLVAPANNETDVAVAVFEWELVSAEVEADGFVLYYDTDDDPVNGGTQVQVPYNKRHKLINLPKDGTMYYWTVKAVRYEVAMVRDTKAKIRVNGTSSNREVWAFTMLNEATTTPEEPGNPTPPQNDADGQEEIPIPPVQIQLPGGGGQVVVDATIEIETTGADAGNALGNVTVTPNEDPVNEGLFHPENVALSYTVQVDPPATSNPAFVTVTLRLSYAGLGYMPSEVLWFNGSVWEEVAGVTWDDPFAVFTIDIPVNSRAGSAEFTFNGSDGSSALPVTWDGTFNAIFVEATELVELTWKTVSESGMQGYQVYRGNSSNLDEAISYGEELIASNNIQGSEYKFEDTEIYEGDTYYYWIETRELLSAVTKFHGPVRVDIESTTAPEFTQVTNLSDAYPNPFNPSVNIKFSVKEGEEARLEIYNVLGQKVKDFGVYTANTKGHLETWHGVDDNGTSVGSGVYFYRLSSPSKTVIKKMMLIK